ncbi:MAG: YihA family ribosome biogenesis GTP-binding protein [Clostridia bacterium]|nr:YihA family ribosome biogenesis GTP-binding protein [Clostridia bacterium]
MNINNVKFEASFGTASQLRASDLPEIVFAGKSNVGKSSLINKFFNRKNLARVSGVPGKTTTINFFLVDGVRIADLPGYGYAKRSDNERRRWGELMEAYFASERNIKLVIQLLDMRHEPTEDDKTMLGFLEDAGFPFICVLTKCDKLNKTEREQRRKAFAENPYLKASLKVIEASAQNGEGMKELKETIENSIAE